MNCKSVVEVDDKDSYDGLNVFPQHTASLHLAGPDKTGWIHAPVQLCKAT